MLSNPDIAAANIGIAEPSQLEELLLAVDLGPLPGDVLARLEVLCNTDFDRAE